MAVFGFLVLMSVLSTTANADEKEDIKSLNEVESLQVFGDLITILAKNATEPGTPDADPFDQYLSNHIIRIKAPSSEGKHLDFELNDLIPAEVAEGREKRRKGPIREILIPLLLAIKHKATVVLPIFMTFVTILALKGFWAGITGLIISKVVGLKLLLQSQEKRDDDQEEEEQDDYHGNDNNENSDADHDENGDPIVIYLHPHGHRRMSKRQESARPAKGYYGAKGWGPWRRRRQLGRTNWGNSSSNQSSSFRANNKNSKTVKERLENMIN